MNNPLIEMLTKKAESEIERIQKSIDMLQFLPIAELQEAFPQGSWVRWWASGWNFQLPMDFGLIDDVMKFMEKQTRWRVSYDFQHVWDEDKDATRIISYVQEREHGNYDYVTFDIRFEIKREGSTCVLNQLGTEKKEVPVYEIVCAAGAAEPIK